MSSRKACAILAGLIAALILCNVARAGVVAVERESLVEAAIQNDQAALADSRVGTSFDAFSDSVTLNDDANNTGNAFAEQTSNLNIVGGQLRGFDVHGTCTSGGSGASADGRFALVFDVTFPGARLTTAGQTGGGGQSSPGIGEMVLRNLSSGGELLHLTSGEEAADLDASVDLPPGRYDLTLTYESDGFAGAQADLAGSVASVPLPAAASNAFATALLASLARFRVGERRRPA